MIEAAELQQCEMTVLVKLENCSEVTLWRRKKQTNCHRLLPVNFFYFITPAELPLPRLKQQQPECFLPNCGLNKQLWLLS